MRNVYIKTLITIGISAVIALVMIVSVSASQFNVRLDYVNELIEITNVVVPGDIPGELRNLPVQLMYTIDATVVGNPKRQVAEKWYPIYGNVIDISKYIPKY